MRMTVVRNVFALAGLMALSIAYYVFVGSQLRPPLAAGVNILFIPMLLGGIGHFALAGRPLSRLLLLLLVPVANRIYLGADPAYVWLSNLVTIASATALCVGFGLAHYLTRCFAKVWS